MNLADLSIRRPIFMVCLVILMLVGGLFFARQMPVDLLPNVSFPYVAVTVMYPGASPEEIEQLLTKPMEEEIGAISGLKHINSNSSQGFALVWAEFTLETDPKWAEQQVRDKVSLAKARLPKDIEEPIIQRFDPSDMPILIYALTADLSQSELFDIADEYIRPKLEQVNEVSAVKVFGGRKREIKVELNREKLKQYEVSAMQVAAQIGATGMNIPLGATHRGGQEMIHRSIGQFSSIDKIRTAIVRFLGDDIAVTVGDLGEVKDSLRDESSRAFIGGTKAIFFYVHRQSGANTVEVTDRVKKQVGKIQEELKRFAATPKIELVRDGSVQIKDNIQDVRESIIIGAGLAVLVVLLFLGNIRSTLITGVALPNSLIGAFILMGISGFSINMMSLLALSLAVGLLVDDAIVVRENIFRHMEQGMGPEEAAKVGTEQVKLAVIGTTLAILAVFGSIAFLKGIVGQFLKEFGLTICYAMVISLFDALAIAPMLSTYLGGISKKKTKPHWSTAWLDFVLKQFEKFQDRLVDFYEQVLKLVLAHPIKTLVLTTLVFVVSTASLKWVSMTFQPTPDLGEYQAKMEMPPGTALDRMGEIAAQVDEILRKNKYVEFTALTVGTWSGEPNKAEIYFRLIPFKARKVPGTRVKDEVRDLLRDQMKDVAGLTFQVTDFDPMNGGLRPFAMQLTSLDPKALDDYGPKVVSWLQKSGLLRDVDTTNRVGKPEFQVKVREEEAKKYGVSGNVLGQELRAQVEGVVASKFRENGKEYDIRVRLEESQRHLDQEFSKTFIPNVNYRLISLPRVAEGKVTTGLAQINRGDRMRVYDIQGDYVPGIGLGEILEVMRKTFNEGELKLPMGVNYKLMGEAEFFEELVWNMIMAGLLGMLFIYLVLASLYESFVTPLTILLALPLALCGAFVALAVMRESLNIYSMIACIMLLGVAAKNSILLVDFANQLLLKGHTHAEAILIAGRERLRPILMTTMALIAGTLPIAIGLNESSRQRTSMGVAIVGGLISSTLLTLIVIPAAYSYIERFRVFIRGFLKRTFSVK